MFLERYLQVALEEEELAWSVSEIQIGMLEEEVVARQFKALAQIPILSLLVLEVGAELLLTAKFL